jgi:hypothetical protein
VEHIQDLILQGTRDFYVRQKAIDILLERGVKPKDYLGEIRALFEWVRDNVRYTKDPFKVELLHASRRMLELRAGDCDDMAILLGALLEAVGHPVRLVLVGPDPGRPLLFSHIYLEAYHRGRWIPLDPTMPYPMGWAPRALVKNVIPIRRRAGAMIPSRELQGAAAIVAPPVRRRVWLRSLIRAVARDGLQPRDPRVRALWYLLRRRGLLDQSPRLKRTLRIMWARGLRPRPRPRTARLMATLLRQWGLLTPFRGRRPFRRQPLPLLPQVLPARPSVGPSSAPLPARRWLRSLIRAVARDGLQPRDPRVRALWYLLRRRGLLDQSPRLMRQWGLLAPFGGRQVSRRPPWRHPLVAPIPFTPPAPLIRQVPLAGFVRTDGSEVPLSIRPMPLSPTTRPGVIPVVPAAPP